MSEECGVKTRAATAADQSSRPLPNYYGTFQGVANHQPQPPPPNYSVIGIPQPAPPAISCPQPHHCPQGYPTVPGYVVAHESPLMEEGLPCFGIGLGWFLFIIGFLLGAIPWYIGTFILLCVRMDYREKPGLIACTIAGVVAALFLLYFN